MQCLSKLPSALRCTCMQSVDQVLLFSALQDRPVAPWKAALQPFGTQALTRRGKAKSTAATNRTKRQKGQSGQLGQLGQ